MAYIKEIVNGTDATEFSHRLDALLDIKSFSSKGRGRQVKLAEAMGVSQNAVNKWLNGESLPRRKMMRIIAAYFQCHLAWLEYGVLEVNGTENINDQTDSEEYVTAMEANKLLSQKFVYRKIPLNCVESEDSMAGKSYESEKLTIIGNDGESIGVFKHQASSSGSSTVGIYTRPAPDLSSTFNENTSPAPEITQLPLISWTTAGTWEEVQDPLAPYQYEELIPVTKRYSNRAFALRIVGDSMQASDGPSFPSGCVIAVEPQHEATNGSFVVVRLEDSKEATFKQLVIDGPKRYLKPLNTRYPIMEIEEEATICGVVRQMVMDFS